MYKIIKYNLLKDKQLYNLLINTDKKPIFRIGNMVGEHKSVFNGEYNSQINNEFKLIIDKQLSIFKKYNIKIKNNIYIENREMLLKDGDVYENYLHKDSYNDSGKPCFTSVYYYKIDKTIKGGEVLFHPFKIYKPKEGDILLFDGDWKHKVNNTYGPGKRCTLIMNFMKDLSYTENL